LKRILYLFLYLNIYTCIFTNSIAQKINLLIEAESTIPEGLKDSLLLQKSFADYLSLKHEADSLPIKLQRLGYIESSLQLFEKKNDTTYIAQYNFGKRYTHIKIFYSEESFSKKELSSISSEVTNTYFIIPFEKIETSLQKLNNIKTENGNAFAKLSLKTIQKEGSKQLSANLVLESGSKRIIDSIAIKGYEKFPRSFIKYFAGIKKGKTFNQKKLIKQNNVINNLAFVSTRKAPEVLFRKDSTIVYFYLEKRNANLFDGVLGFATDEKTKKLRFNGYLNLELNNNLNYGEQLIINYKADGDEQINFKVKANLPYLFQSPFGVGLEFKIFKRDSSFITTEQQVRATYQISPATNSYIGYKSYESSNLLDEIVVGSPIEDFTSRFLIAGAAFSKLQNSVLFPHKLEASLETEAGSRDLKNSKDNQLKLITTINNIFNLNYKNSIFIQNSTNILVSDTYLTNELFRFGGITSIRGFDENSIDASLFSVINTEYRYLFNQTFYLHSIIDIAYFENKTLHLKEKLYSYGIGLGLKTKSGLLKLNIANGNSENQPFNFSNTKIHIILSSRF
jgi:outer membrane protein assembly factor BamA